jgi:hypothetical protein
MRILLIGAALALVLAAEPAAASPLGKAEPGVTGTDLLLLAGGKGKGNSILNGNGNGGGVFLPPGQAKKCH